MPGAPSSVRSLLVAMPFAPRRFRMLQVFKHVQGTFQKRTVLSSPPLNGRPLGVTASPWKHSELHHLFVLLFYPLGCHGLRLKLVQKVQGRHSTNMSEKCLHASGRCVCVWRINDNTACQLGNGGVSSGLCRAHKHTPTHICILVEFGINTASCCSDVQAFHVSCRPVTLVVRLVCLGCPVSVFGPSAPHSCILIVSGIQLIEASKHGSIANISTNVKLTKSLDRENTRTLENQ